jgi:hypothetical protein
MREQLAAALRELDMDIGADVARSIWQLLRLHPTARRRTAAATRHAA